MLTSGTLLGERYEIIEKIGAGGMSIVYKARDNRLQRFVAIKELREEYIQDEEFVSKFRREALSAARLSHPNIVGIYDVGRDQQIDYIVMEYVEGRTLKQVIEQEGPFEAETVLELGVQIVSALKHAHNNKIIHRDIKPQNILMTKEGILKVTDFGIAKAVDSSTIVAAGSAIGSVHYFSPEQAKGRYVNESSDLYSCGIVLFELATKKLPFEADSHISIALKHINEVFPKPSTFNTSIPHNVENIILKATAKNQADRYQNAEEMLKDMKGVLQDPNYKVEEQLIHDKTILLTSDETQMLRNNQVKNLSTSGQIDKELSEGMGASISKGLPVNASPTESIYEDTSSFRKNEVEESAEISTFYKVVASIGGILVALALVVTVTVAFVWWIPNMKGKTYRVPNIINMTLEEAQQALQQSDLNYRVNPVETTEAEKGMVLKQEPAAGEVVKKGSYVEITVATTPDKEVLEEEQREEEIILPNFIGDTLSEVREEIDRLGLKLDAPTYENNEAEPGLIISQTPRGNKKVKPGDTIHIVISNGPEVTRVKVPNVVGMTVDTAESVLKEFDLRVKVKEEYSNAEVGYVIKQSLSKGTLVEEGTRVDITVSKGPEPSKEPPVEEPPVEEPPVEKPPIEEPVVDPPSQDPITIQKVVSLPTDIEQKEEYHLLVKLTLSDGSSQIVTDQIVKATNFPYALSVEGYGEGTIEVFIDNNIIYNDPIKFE